MAIRFTKNGSRAGGQFEKQGKTDKMEQKVPPGAHLMVGEDSVDPEVHFFLSRTHICPLGSLPTMNKIFKS